MKTRVTIIAVVFAVAIHLGAVLAIAGYEEGLAAYNRGDFATALNEFSKAAQEGDSRSQLSLGLMYQTGKGVTKSDAEALKWYYKAADNTQNDALARKNLQQQSK